MYAEHALRTHLQVTMEHQIPETCMVYARPIKTHSTSCPESYSPEFMLVPLNEQCRVVEVFYILFMVIC